MLRAGLRGRRATKQPQNHAGPSRGSPGLPPPLVTQYIFVTSLSKVSSCPVKLLISRAGYQRLKTTRQRMMGT